MLEKFRPSRPDPTPNDDPRVVRIDSDDADDVLGAISSSTARRILASLHDTPKTTSELADELETSLSNINHHLSNLRDAGLIEVVDTWYSEKGNEMQVYGPADGPVVLAGTDERASRVRSLLQRVFGAVGILAVVSVVVQWLVETVLLPQTQVDIIRKVAPAGQLEGLSFTPIPPGLLFFAGGTFILALGVAWWYVTTHR